MSQKLSLFLHSWIYFPYCCIMQMSHPANYVGQYTLTIRGASRENLSLGFPTRSDTNPALQPQKMARLEISDMKQIDCIIFVVKTMMLISCTVTAATLFLHMQKTGFLLIRHIQYPFFIFYMNILGLFLEHVKVSS